jgi:hypothetical protein
VVQYLIIGLVTERDRLGGLLKLFDESTEAIRKKIAASENAAPPDGMIGGA